MAPISFIVQLGLVNGPRIFLEADPTASFLGVKEMLTTNEHIDASTDELRLFHSGRVCEDNRCLADYGLTSGSQLELRILPASSEVGERKFA